MDGSVSRGVVANHCALFAIGVCLLASAADAQVLSDPTRPPDAPAQGHSEVTVDGSSGADAAPVLQSVLQSGSRRYAMINGKSYKVGDKYGEARVASIAESEVMLRKGAERTVLKMYPDVEKKPSASSLPPAAKVERKPVKAHKPASKPVAREKQ